MEDLSVLVSTPFVDTDGVMRLTNYMSDKSIWICDVDATHWKPAVPPTEALTAGFKRELQAKKTEYAMHTSRGHMCTTKCAFHV